MALKASVVEGGGMAVVTERGLCMEKNEDSPTSGARC